MEKKDLADKVKKWAEIAVLFGGLGIGTFVLEYKHGLQMDEVKELIQSENEKHSDAIKEHVTEAIKDDLKGFRDSINTDHKRLMESNFKKDSLLLIVIPRMLEQIKESTNTAKRVEAKIESKQPNDQQAIWDYLKQREQRDSILNRDAQIMRELRRINQQLTPQPKFGDRAK